ncbi:MAG: nucleotidyltransferase family protein [Eubacterium sp.]
MNYSSVENEYLVKMLRAALKSEPLPPVPDNIDWDRLIALSKSQQVYSMIAPVIDMNCLTQEQALDFKNHTQSELMRILAMRNELDEIKAQLKNEKIKFMLLKGSVIRRYYPQEKMRQMSDIDILYCPDDREKLVRIMKSRGFYLSTAEANSDDFYKNPFYLFEFHREIFDEADQFHPDFDLWKRATVDSENPYEHHMSKEDIFIYTLCHMYDHYCLTGCGIRFVCDIYVILNAFDSFDWDYINSTFEKFGFKQFCDTAIGLAKALFDDDSTITEQEQQLFDFIMSGGVYGKGIDIKKIIDEDFGGSKLKYILHRLFPPKNQMKGNYLELRERPYLLPYFYIKRLFEKVSYHSNLMKEELRKIMK